MAIEKHDGQQNNAQAGNASDRSGQSTGSVNAGTASAAPTQRKVGITEVGGIRRASFGRFGLGESVEAYKKGIEKILEAQISVEDRSNFIIEVMNRDTDKIFMSTVLVVRATHNNGVPYAAVYALPIESSNPIEDRRVFQSGGRTSEISWAPTDTLDTEFGEQMTRHIKSKFGEEFNVLYAGGRVLPIELKSDDEAHLSRVLFEVDQALSTAIETHVSGHQAVIVNVAMFAADNARAQVFIDPTPTERDDSTGLPTRSGLNVQLRASKTVSMQQQNQSLNQREQDVVLARVDAYVDAIYDTQHLGQPAQGPGWQNQRPSTQCFIPRVVITALDSQVDVLTPEISLLGIACLTVLSKNPGNWANSLRPRHANNMSADLARMSDIGALGYAVPLNPADPADLRKVDTSAKNFADKDFEALIEASFIPDPIYTILVPESGERSWLNDMYAYAADGDVNANNRIIEVADNLTGGLFSQLWNARGGGNIVHNDENRVHMGYFVDNSGKRVDLQTIDTIAMFNLFGEKDPAMVFDWINTFNPTTDTMEARIATRETILRSTFNQVTIKGYARSVTFYADFLDVFMHAINQAGLVFSPQNTRLNDFATKPKFGMFDPQAFALPGSRTGNAFSYGQLQNTPNYRGISGMGMSGSYGRGSF